jgi:hypothetical protein
MESLFVPLLIVAGVLFLVLVFKNFSSSKSTSPQPTLQAPAGTEPSMQERIAATTKQAGLFMDASLILVDLEVLNQEIPKIGASLYLVGAVDALSQKYKMSEDAFLSAAYSALRGFGLSEDNARHLCFNLPEMSQEPFGGAAMIEGGRTIQAWLSGKDESAPVRLSELVREWAEMDPDRI